MRGGLTASARFWLGLAGLNGALVIGLGAYGAHGFDDVPDYLVKSFNSGVQYHMWHTLVLVGVAWLCDRTGGSLLITLSGVAFMVGIVLFSGTLYAFGINGTLPMRGLAPVGGWCLIAGWLLLAIAAWQNR